MLIKNTHTKKHNELRLPKILIVEDDEGIADMYREMFHMLGYHCKIRGTAREAQELVKEYHPNLIIIDYLLPEINGGELCSQIKNDAETCNIPVIICSAYSRVILSLGTYGCDAFIPKPFDLDDMTQTVENLLESHAF